jgi:hypothetical protein
MDFLDLFLASPGVWLLVILLIIFLFCALFLVKDKSIGAFGYIGAFLVMTAPFALFGAVPFSSGGYWPSSNDSLTIFGWYVLIITFIWIPATQNPPKTKQDQTKDNSKKADADALQKKITKSKIPDENVEVESINIEDREKKVKTKNDKNTDSLFDDI